MKSSQLSARLDKLLRKIIAGPCSAGHSLNKVLLQEVPLKHCRWLLFAIVLITWRRCWPTPVPAYLCIMTGRASYLNGNSRGSVSHMRIKDTYKCAGRATPEMKWWTFSLRQNECFSQGRYCTAQNFLPSGLLQHALIATTDNKRFVNVATFPMREIRRLHYTTRITCLTSARSSSKHIGGEVV